MARPKQASSTRTLQDASLHPKISTRSEAFRIELLPSLKLIFVLSGRSLGGSSSVTYDSAG